MIAILAASYGAIFHSASVARPRESRESREESKALPSRSREVAREIEKLGDGGGIWALYAADVKSGAEIADERGGLKLMPASNRKIFSTALALRRMGPEYKFVTRVWASGRIEKSSEQLNGDLILEASGDPAMRPAFLGGRSGLSLLNDWAKKAREAGIQSVAGDAWVDCSAFEEPSPLPPGWGWDQMIENYGSLASALALNENKIVVTARPGPRSGQPCGIDTQPSLSEGLMLENHCLTSASGLKTFRVQRANGPSALALLGSFPLGFSPESLTLPLPDPSAAWAECWGKALERAGIRLQHPPKISCVRRAPRQASAQAVLLAGHESAPLSRIARLTNKESDNHCAEMLYLAAGRYVLGEGSYRNSQAAEKQFLRELGVADSLVDGEDGCGLARTDAIAPRAIVKLLRGMAEGQGAEEFHDSLPLAGEDGTLRYRMSEFGLTGRVAAKTGTLRDVSALSGYIKRSGGGRIAFSMIANHFSVPVAAIRAKQDRLCAILAE